MARVAWRMKAMTFGVAAVFGLLSWPGASSADGSKAVAPRSQVHTRVLFLDLESCGPANSLARAGGAEQHCCDADPQVDSTGAVKADTSGIVVLCVGRDKADIQVTSALHGADVTLDLYGPNGRETWHRPLRTDSLGHASLKITDLRQLFHRRDRAGYYDLIGHSRGECFGIPLRFVW